MCCSYKNGFPYKGLSVSVTGIKTLLSKQRIKGNKELIDTVSSSDSNVDRNMEQYKKDRHSYNGGLQQPICS